MPDSDKCPRCEGSGRYNRVVCALCRGFGSMSAAVQISGPEAAAGFAAADEPPPKGLDGNGVKLWLEATMALCFPACAAVALRIREELRLAARVARLEAANRRLVAACRLWGQGFAEGEEFTPEQLLAWMNANRRAAREAIAAAEGGA